MHRLGAATSRATRPTVLSDRLSVQVENDENPGIWGEPVNLK